MAQAKRDEKSRKQDKITEKAKTEQSKRKQSSTRRKRAIAIFVEEERDTKNDGNCSCLGLNRSFLIFLFFIEMCTSQSEHQKGYLTSA